MSQRIADEKIQEMKRSLSLQPSSEWQDVLADLEEARAALIGAMKITSSCAGFIAGVLDAEGSDGAGHPLVIETLRWEAKTRALLGLPPEELPPDDFSPWARVTRKALAATEEKTDG